MKFIEQILSFLTWLFTGRSVPKSFDIPIVKPPIVSEPVEGFKKEPGVRTAPDQDQDTNKLIGIFAPFGEDEEEAKKVVVFFECIRNGVFSVEAYWTWTDYWEWLTQRAYYRDTAIAGLVQEADDMLENVEGSKNYVLKFTVSSPGTGRISFYNAAFSVLYIAAGDYVTGSYVLHFVTPANVSGGGFQIYGTTSGSAFYIDNLSLKRE